MDANKFFDRSASFLRLIFWVVILMLGFQTPPGQWALNQLAGGAAGARRVGSALLTRIFQVVSPIAIWTLRITLLVYFGCAGAALISWQYFDSLKTAYWLFFCGSMLTCFVIAALYGKEHADAPGDNIVKKIFNSWHYALVGISMLITAIAIMVDYYYFLPDYVASGDLRMGLIFGTISFLILFSIVFARRTRTGLTTLFIGRMCVILWLVWMNIGNGEIIKLTMPTNDYFLNYSQSTIGKKTDKVVPAQTTLMVDRSDFIEIPGKAKAFACYPTDTDKNDKWYLWIKKGVNYVPYKPPKPNPGKG